MDNNVVSKSSHSDQLMMRSSSSSLGSRRSFRDCPICGSWPATPHFGAVSCDACAAFFRRSVAKRNEYFCRKGKRCDLKLAALRRKIICRYCRFISCLQSGMYIAEVQANAEPFKEDSSPFETMVRAWRWTFLLRHAEAVEQSGGPQFYSPMTSKFRTSDSASLAIKVEARVLKRFLDVTRIPIELNIPLDALVRHSLLNWIAFEQHRSTARNLGFLSNTCFSSDESIIPLTESGIVNYFRSYEVRDPEFLTRFTQKTCFVHLMSVSKVFYETRLDDEEQVALAILCLLRSVNRRCTKSVEGATAITNHVVLGLQKHLSENYKDFALRFASLVELIPLIEAFRRLWDDVSVMFQLNGAMRVGMCDKPIYPCLPELVRRSGDA